MKTLVKTSSHSTRFANSGKRRVLDQFIQSYRAAVWSYVDWLWHNRVVWGDQVLDVQNNRLAVPNFISTTGIPIDSDLSARALKRAASDALAIIRSRTEKHRKQLWVLSQLMRAGDVNAYKRLQSKIDSNPLSKPTRQSIKSAVVLDSNCCKFIPSKTAMFDGFLKIYAIGKTYGHIYIPVKFTKHTARLRQRGYERITSWQITATTANSLWQLTPSKSSGSKTLGADQGLTTCLSLSDGQTTPTCIHGHDLKSIIADLSRKRKGSKSFGRAQAHRTNYINWSIGQLNLHDLKELRLEKLYQMRTGERTSRNLGHWTYTAINAAVINRCEELGVQVVEQSATYRSQRCSDCGWTQKSNRKGKEFICRACGATHDADINGALNHEADLYRLPVGIWQLQLNRAGFYWKTHGLFDSAGREITVPDVNKYEM